MNSAFVTVGVIVGGIVLSGCETLPSGQRSANDQALKKMSSERLRSALNGNSVKWPDGSTVYYSGSEIKTLGFDGESLVGEINFSNDQHCSSWSGGGERCSTVYEGADGKLSFFVEGETDSSSGYALILKGNPDKL